MQRNRGSRDQGAGTGLRNLDDFRITVVAGLARIQMDVGLRAEFLRIQLHAAIQSRPARTGYGWLSLSRFRVGPGGPALLGGGCGRSVHRFRGSRAHQLVQQTDLRGASGQYFDFALSQGRNHAPRQNRTSSRRVGVTLVTALTGHRWTTVVKGMSTHRTTGEQRNETDGYPSQHCARHRTNLSRPMPDSAFSEKSSDRYDQDADNPTSPEPRQHYSPWDMRRLSGIFGQKVDLTRIFLQIPAQIGASR